MNASRFSRARLRIDTSTRRYTCCRDPCLFRKHLEHEREPLTSDHQRKDTLLVSVHRIRHGVLDGHVSVVPLAGLLWEVACVLLVVEAGFEDHPLGRPL